MLLFRTRIFLIIRIHHHLLVLVHRLKVLDLAPRERSESLHALHSLHPLGRSIDLGLELLLLKMHLLDLRLQILDVGLHSLMQRNGEFWELVVQRRHGTGVRLEQSLATLLGSLQKAMHLALQRAQMVLDLHLLQRTGLLVVLGLFHHMVHDLQDVLSRRLPLDELDHLLEQDEKLLLPLHCAPSSPHKRHVELSPSADLLEGQRHIRSDDVCTTHSCDSVVDVVLRHAGSIHSNDLISTVQETTDVSRTSRDDVLNLKRLEIHRARVVSKTNANSGVSATPLHIIFEKIPTLLCFLSCDEIGDSIKQGNRAGFRGRLFEGQDALGRRNDLARDDSTR
mmetsp:Transcript_62727/g.147593  ORF Transcript_62727/g.147593 Transcript_62727/m.147593 type:complete len:338 (+) Transcript_62727:140-1153(+)